MFQNNETLVMHIREVLWVPMIHTHEADIIRIFSLVEVSANLTVVLGVGIGLMVDPNFKMAALCSMDRESANE
jgi:hypothetical protein